jgi:7-carboxy-7-deazaguanine synthase
VSASLPISETFTSIQGEGKLTGVPSFFIRVSGCNLRCGWCDTPYASWSPDGTTQTLETLADQAQASGVKHIVLTGGEPMMFDAVTELSQKLRASGLHITIETAGTIHRDLACDLMSISPKLANSDPGTSVAPDARDPLGIWRERHQQRRTNPAALQALIDTYEQRQLKFVITSPADLAEIDTLLHQLRNWAPDDILLMPEGIAPPTRDQTDWVVAECLRRNWRYCRRLHIDLFGNKRGT